MTHTYNDEFKVGKNSIGYINSRFESEFSGKEFKKKGMPTFQKPGKPMSDAQIESELKPGLCELGDVLAFIKNAPEQTKDGYSNLFYFPAFVVSVNWRADGSGWGVDTWDRDGGGWGGGGRVFSPATDRLETQSSALGSSETLTYEQDVIAEAIKTVKKAGYQVSKIV